MYIRAGVTSPHKTHQRTDSALLGRPVDRLLGEYWKKPSTKPRNAPRQCSYSMRSNHLGTTPGFEQDMKNAVLLGLPVKRMYLAAVMSARYANPRDCDTMIGDGDPMQYWTRREGRTIRAHFHFRSSAMSRPGLVAYLSHDSFMQVLIIPCSSLKI